MSEPKTYTNVLKDAMARKHAAQHPDNKTSAGTGKVKKTAVTPKGPPVRRGASRGG